MTYLRLPAPADGSTVVRNEQGKVLVTEVVCLEDGSMELRVPLPARVREDLYVVAVPFRGTAHVSVVASSPEEAKELVLGWKAAQHDYFMKAVAKGLSVPAGANVEVTREVGPPPAMQETPAGLVSGMCPTCNGRRVVTVELDGVDMETVCSACGGSGKPTN